MTLSSPTIKRLCAAFALGWCLVYLGAVAWPAAQMTSNGFAAYYTAAHLLIHEPAALDRVYNDEWFADQVVEAGFTGVYDIYNVQPPTMSLLLSPLAWLPPAGARAVWILLSLLLLPAGLVALARALRLPGRWGLWATPVCLLYAPVSENLWQGQAYLVLFFLLCLLFCALCRSRPWAGGWSLGLMLGLKSAGIWLWPLLGWARRWWLLILALGVAGALVVATLPWVGADVWLAYLRELGQSATAPQRYVTAYQTATSLLGHLFVHDARWNPAPLVDWPRLARGLTLAWLLISLVLTTRWGRLRASPPAERALTLGLFVSLMVVNAPVGEGYHYLWVLPALLVAGWWAWRDRVGATMWGLLLLAGLLMGAPWPYTSPRLQAGAWALLAYPRVYGAVLLWGWLGWALGWGRGSRLTRKELT